MAFRMCGIVIEPPTMRAMFMASKNSSSVIPCSAQRMTWYVMQSLQRRTVDATSPRISFVFTSSAPFS